MEISVIIPVYNKEAYVERCFRQLMAQAFDSFEVIAVDDGSTDRSGEICDMMAQQDSRIRVIHTPNGGVTAARRIGLEASRGRYIMFVDSDDELLPGAMSVMHKTIEQTSADEVIATYYDQYGRLYDTGRRGWADEAGIVRDLLACRLGVCVLWGIIFRRQLLDGCMDTPREIRSGEDIMMQIKCLMKRPKVYFIDTPIYLYNMGLPNDRQLSLHIERLYDEVLRQSLQPRWEEFSDYFTLHQLKVYENFVDARQWNARRDYYDEIRPRIKSQHPLTDRIAFYLPPRLSYLVVHTYKRLRVFILRARVLFVK